MAFTKIGDFGNLLRDYQGVDARRIRGGVITAQEIILAGGTHGVIRSQNFVETPLTGWAIFGDGSAFFGAGVTVGGDIVSGNWDGALPVNLASADTTATTGYAFDSSVGAAQFMGDLFIGGEIFVGDTADQHLELGASSGVVDRLAWYDGAVNRAVMGAVAGGSRTIITFIAEPETNTSALSATQTAFEFAWGDDAVGWGKGTIDLYVGLTQLSTATQWLLNSGHDAAAPPLAFLLDEDTGIYRHTTNSLGFSTLGVSRGWISSAGDWRIGHENTTGKAVIRSAEGSASSPTYTFEGDLDTGMYRVGTNVIGFTTAGVAALTIEADGSLRGVSGTEAEPTYSFIADSDTGMRRHTGNRIGFVGGGTTAATFHNGGTASSFAMLSGLNDVGNVEVLRINKDSGLNWVGYFSSWEFDPVSGERRKQDFIPLLESPRFPGLHIIDDLRMYDFQRVSTEEREWGTNLNRVHDYDDNLRYLTTKGDQWGSSVDEMAHIAVLWEGVRDLRARVAELEALVDALRAQ